MDLELGLRSATELLALLDQGDVTSVELLEVFLARNDALGPDLNAIVTLDIERARRDAEVADAVRAAGESAPLLGLPMTVKDALAVAGVRCTGGAVELRHHVAPADAEVVTRLREAGAVIFGKTNLPRWSADAQAFNEIFGTTNNPWDLERGPGGSSGGASAAIAAGLSGAELGTDIGGSVRLPAHFAGVCGHKPSFGIVPQRGYVSHVTYASSEPDVNVIGPIARSVDDLELLLDVIAGPPARLAAGWRLELPDARPSGLDEVRIASHLDDPACPVGSEVGAVLGGAAAALLEAGASVTPAWPHLDFADVFDVGLPLISAATSPGRTPEEFERMRDIVATPDGVEPSLLMRAQATAMYHRDWLLLGERRAANQQAWSDFFERFDVLLAPVSVTPAFPHAQEGTLYERSIEIDGAERPYSDIIVWTSQFGYVGLPSTVVPVGFTDADLPVGIQVVGPHLGDRTTLAVARHLEALLGGYRVPPLAELSSPG